jgi:fibronectin type 3 domain-containing protein
MTFNAFGFLIGRTVAKGRGVSDQEATRLGLVASMLRPPALGIVVTAAIAGNEAQSANAVPGPVLILNQPTTSSSPDSVNLNWNAITGASAYYVFRGFDAQRPSYLDQSSMTSYSDQSADKETTYYYSVHAVDASNNLIASSNVVPFWTPKTFKHLLTATQSGSNAIDAIAKAQAAKAQAEAKEADAAAKKKEAEDAAEEARQATRAAAEALKDEIAAEKKLASAELKVAEAAEKEAAKAAAKAKTAGSNR